MVLQRKIWMWYFWVSLNHPCWSYFGACVKSLYSIGMSRHQDADFRLDRRYKRDSFTRSLNGPDRHPTVQVILTICMAQNLFLAIETGYRFTSIFKCESVTPMRAPLKGNDSWAMVFLRRPRESREAWDGTASANKQRTVPRFFHPGPRRNG